MVFIYQTCSRRVGIEFIAVAVWFYLLFMSERAHLSALALNKIIRDLHRICNGCDATKCNENVLGC